MAFSELLERAGGMGLFQALQVFTILPISIFIPPQLFMDIFLAATPGHRCWVRMLDNGSEVPTNLTPEALLAVSIPLGPNREPDQCRRFRQPQWQLLEPNATATNWSEAATEPCVDGWVYDLSTFTSTMVAEWGLVCASQNLKPVGQGVMMAGFLLGFLAWGLLSSWFGRKPILSWCCLQVAVANTSTIFAPNFLIYCGLRFLSTFGLAGVLMTTSTLVVEWTTTRWVDLTVTILGCTYGIGHMALGGLAFVLRDWRALNLALSTPFFAFFLISCSPLLASLTPTSLGEPVGIPVSEDQHRIWKDVVTLTLVTTKISEDETPAPTLTVALFFPEVLLSSMKEELASGKTRYSMLDLFRVPSLRLRSSCMCIVSFCVMISYYGLALDLQSLGSDIFLLQILFGAMDFLSRSTCTFLFRFFSRRTLIASFLIMAGLSILGNALVPQGFTSYGLALDPQALDRNVFLLQVLAGVFDLLAKTGAMLLLSRLGHCPMQALMRFLRSALAMPGLGRIGAAFTCIPVYTGELFPTVVRMTTMGVGQTSAQGGAILGPLLQLLGVHSPSSPLLMCGAEPVLSGLATPLLPETQSLPLPGTTQDVQSQ
ncbi:Solute carrier family 22 member 11 [Pteropus alecto]|uniref:Solute carrier family 22 member 11 n=1 Tax=Pteropus alecto TaxID=9402 RepID=L5KR13_PTEAL|nr:Solute carrier family 22 member 11 [Pteropus alecto]